MAWGIFIKTKSMDLKVCNILSDKPEHGEGMRDGQQKLNLSFTSVSQ